LYEQIDEILEFGAGAPWFQRDIGHPATKLRVGSQREAFISEVQINGSTRSRYGNHIYGAFGHDFDTKDGRKLMVAAVSVGQWKALCKATGIGDAIKTLEQRDGTDFTGDADRFAGRDAIFALLAPWFAARTLAEAAALLDADRVCWGAYQSFEQLVHEDPRCSTANALFAEVEHPGIGNTLTPRTPIDFSGVDAVHPLIGPVLGQHTDEVLLEVLKLSSSAIGVLHDKRIIAGIQG
jgi:2-methylfumaryl-CoA isomerase